MSMRGRVEVLLNTAGRTITYKRFASSTAPSTLKRSISYTNFIIKAFVADYSPRDIVGQIQEGDRKVYISAKAITFTPETRDRVAVGDKTYDVVAINNLAAKGEETIYILRIRGL